MPFLAQIFLGESISKIDIMTLFCGFLGIILVNSSEENSNSSKSPNEMLGATLSLIGGISSSFAWICIRKMSTMCHFSIAPFYFSLGSTILGSVLYVIHSASAPPPVVYNWQAVLLLVALSILTFIGQITLVLAYQYEKAARVAVFSYLQTFLVTSYDVMFFGNSIGLLEAVGAALILG